MVLNPEGKSILNSDKSRLKANGVQERAKGVLLIATSGLIATSRWATVGILKLIEQLGGKLRQMRPRG